MFDALANTTPVKAKFPGAFSAMETLAKFADPLNAPENTYDTKVNYRPTAQ